ncbi:YgeY family selenium metabolism-linked hydrolase [endosymbiont 'TC1' of Trimyema compressum]|uniref:YgeY family selenium metabolism-linked hydrolase n=1 Tax=endosymbiont 'TC1' of Trimyema compressum TaxID=243899 RepID=UPI000A4B8D04|nr:YgeY family selenium metabolism-linked hydrolase [endosymbiont 'TC1' of Trimyema compressum]
MSMNFKDILLKAEDYKEDMTKFLRDMVAIPSESCEEEGVVKRIKEEMDKVGFDETWFDGLGNVIGRIGNGKTVIAMDAHIDTVGIGNIKNWTECDPYEGKVVGDDIYGRGTSDQESGMASMVYAGKIIKDLGLEDDFTLYVVGSVQEEDCDGLCWQWILEKEVPAGNFKKPEFVVITEPTSLRIYRGHRGRMEIRVDVKGISCHGSAPERGENAIYKMAPIIMELRALHENLHYDAFLGKGSLAVSQIFYTSPSRCAVADSCAISIDRRLTDGETWESALEEVRNLPSVKEADGVVSLYTYDRPSWKGTVYETESYFPTWVIPEADPVCQTLVEAGNGLFNKENFGALKEQKELNPHFVKLFEGPVVDKWTFSTNGVSIMGRHGVKCIGFGPGDEEQAHAPNEKAYKSHLVAAAALYAAIPKQYVDKYVK